MTIFLFEIIIGNFQFLIKNDDTSKNPLVFPDHQNQATSDKVTKYNRYYV